MQAKNAVVNNSYFYEDKIVNKGFAYYRQKVIDKDDKYTYSSVVKINGKKCSP